MQSEVVATGIPFVRRSRVVRRRHLVVTSVAAGALYPRVARRAPRRSVCAEHARRRERRRARRRRLDPRDPERRHGLHAPARRIVRRSARAGPGDARAATRARPTARSRISPTTACSPRTTSRSRAERRRLLHRSRALPAARDALAGRVMIYGRDGSRAHVRRRLLLLQRHRVRARRHRRGRRAPRPAAGARRRQPRVGDRDARPGGGDGFCLDADGRFYVASTIEHGIRVVEPDGTVADFWPDRGQGLCTNCCFGGPDLRTLFVADAIPGSLVAFEGCPTPGLPLPPGPGSNRRERRTTSRAREVRAARSAAQASGSSRGQPLLGQVEVLDAEAAAVVEPLEPGEHRGEVDDAGSDRRRAPACARACPDAAARGRRGRAARTGRRPSRRRGRCRRAAARPAPRRETRAPRRPSSRPRRPTARAARRARPSTSAPRAPTCRQPAVGRRRRAPAGLRLRERGRASDRQRERRRVGAEQRVDVLEAVGPRPRARAVGTSPRRA